MSKKIKDLYQETKEQISLENIYLGKFDYMYVQQTCSILTDGLSEVFGRIKLYKKVLEI